MSPFQKKRLDYFVKQAKEYGWVRLSIQDVEILKTYDGVDLEFLQDEYARGYEEGYADASYEKTKYDIERDALQDTY